MKAAVIAWAEEHLPEQVHFIGISLGTNPALMGDLTPGPAGARADLFAESPGGIIASPNCKPEAIQVARDLVSLMGATPHFMDPVEFDGVSTAVNLMPALVANALMAAVTDSPGWREARHLASNDLVHFSHPVTAGAAALAQAASLNKETVLRWLDATWAELETLRELVKEDQYEQLALYLESAVEARKQWVVDWQVNVWDRAPKTELPESGGVLGQLFGFGRRKSQDD
jgi:prephenate dehydrogenase